MSPASAHLDAATTQSPSVLAELGIASGVVRIEWVVVTGPAREDSATLIATVACAQGDGHTLSMELVLPTSRRVLATGLPCEVSRFAPDLVHLGVADDRMLSAVVRICAGRLKVLYARTAIIESLDIKGGCVEPPTGTPGRTHER